MLKGCGGRSVLFGLSSSRASLRGGCVFLELSFEDIPEILNVVFTHLLLLYPTCLVALVPFIPKELIEIVVIGLRLRGALAHRLGHLTAVYVGPLIREFTSKCHLVVPGGVLEKVGFLLLESAVVLGMAGGGDIAGAESELMLSVAHCWCG